MGFDERWQRRQQEIAADTDTREADRVRRHNDQVEKIHQQHVQAARHAFERGDGWFEAEIPQHAVGRLDVHAVLRTKHDHPDVPRPAGGDILGMHLFRRGHDTSHCGTSRPDTSRPTQSPSSQRSGQTG
ncbi:hypothetical protein OG616_13960 [Streptomyces antibioticus]|uniref:hypothetical protein n=1 Tax=Streptomyces antibioticus TaxID=1890 RepID=UPI00225AF108|nr:hypothetical protein [Streptomyces antibioticus]MCX5169123.1 hypothetical protein [Streptomyces antibioticus]